MTRSVRLGIGAVAIAFGIYLAMSPLTVAAILDRPHDTTSQMINVRASWGGTLVGLGAFLAWLPALRPWSRAVIGLLGWAMAGIGAARTIGFVLDGAPDARQWLWISLEVAIAIGSVIGLRIVSRRQR